MGGLRVQREIKRKKWMLVKPVKDITGTQGGVLSRVGVENSVRTLF
jgi:hypothetical protein